MLRFSGVGSYGEDLCDGDLDGDRVGLVPFHIDLSYIITMALETCKSLRYTPFGFH